jgi:hypothetical protein
MTSLARHNSQNVAGELSANSSTSSLSMEETPPQHNGTPPEYEALVQSARLHQKFNIQPREDEGCEKLPPYSCAISLENVFMRKVELEGAVHRAHDRNWYRVYATLQGTALTFHKWKGKGVFSKQPDRLNENPDFPAGTKKGSFLRSYNLQHADAGIAVDYFKYVSSLCDLVWGMLIVGKKTLCDKSSCRNRSVPPLVHENRNVCSVATIPLRGHRPRASSRRPRNTPRSLDPPTTTQTHTSDIQGRCAGPR